ncbi:MAG: permease prefix domain 1-containing protein [Chloroflexota bacterium]
MTKQIETYLRALKRQLWWRGVFDADALAEAESHLLEAVEAGIRRGLSAEESERQALERFGSVKVVAFAFEKERNTLMQKLLLAIAGLAGLFSVYVDSRPHWDDTGLLAAGLLLVSGLLTLLGHRRPWLIALAIGIWIPMYEIYLSRDFKFLVILLIPFLGAYVGWLAQLGIRKVFHPA